MDGTWFERLSPVDSMFLDVEDRAAHMHVGGVLVCEGTPPSQQELVAHVAARLDRVPRYRQRLAPVPLRLGRPVWVDDPALDLALHVGRSRLAGEGAAALDAHAARFLARPLDRRRPLWALELVEGVGPDRFALLSKTHHCLLDGIAGVEFVNAITDPDPGVRPAVPSGWRARPSPGALARAVAAVRDEAALLLDVARGAPGSEGGRLRADLAAGALPLLALARLGPAGAATSLRAPLGPDRRWATRTFDLAAVKEVRAALGGTVNDVLLAVVAGALGALFAARGEAVRRDLRVFVPVNVRAKAEARGAAGNRVALVFCPLPVGEPDPRARLRRISEAMRQVKEGGQVAGVIAFERLGELVPPTVAAAAIQLVLALRPFDVVVSNIPGPQTPLWLLGRRILACHPTIPLAPGQTLSVGLLSYAGAVDVGVLAAAERVPELDVFADALPGALEALVAAARAAAPAASPARVDAPAGTVPAEAVPALAEAAARAPAPALR